MPSFCVGRSYRAGRDVATHRDHGLELFRRRLGGGGHALRGAGGRRSPRREGARTRDRDRLCTRRIAHGDGPRREGKRRDSGAHHRRHAGPARGGVVTPRSEPRARRAWDRARHDCGVDGHRRLLVCAQRRAHRQSRLSRGLPWLEGDDLSGNDPARIRSAVRPPASARRHAGRLPGLATPARRPRHRRARWAGGLAAAASPAPDAITPIFRVGVADVGDRHPGAPADCPLFGRQCYDVPVRLHPLGQHAVHRAASHLGWAALGFLIDAGPGASAWRMISAVGIAIAAPLASTAGLVAPAALVALAVTAALMARAWSLAPIGQWDRMRSPAAGFAVGALVVAALVVGVHGTKATATAAAFHQEPLFGRAAAVLDRQPAGARVAVFGDQWVYPTFGARHHLRPVRLDGDGRIATGPIVDAMAPGPLTVDPAAFRANLRASGIEIVVVIHLPHPGRSPEWPTQQAALESVGDAVLLHRDGSVAVWAIDR